MKSRTAWLFAGFASFVVSLLLPAVEFVGPPGTLTGFSCAVLGFAFIPGILESLPDGIELYSLYVTVLGFCNLMPIFAAVAIGLNKGARVIKVGLPVAALLVCAGRFILPLSDYLRMEFLAGYYVWAFSFLLLAFAVQRDSTTAA